MVLAVMDMGMILAVMESDMLYVVMGVGMDMDMDNRYPLPATVCFEDH